MKSTKDMSKKSINKLGVSNWVENIVGKGENAITSISEVSKILIPRLVKTLNCFVKD